MNSKSLALTFILMIMAVSALAIDPAQYVLSDIEVVYLYDDPGSIDWATLYYLNDHDHCRVSLVTIRPGGEFRLGESGFDDRQFYSVTAFGDPDSSGFLEKFTNALFKERQPDLIIVGEITKHDRYQPVIDYWQRLTPAVGTPFSIQTILQWESLATERNSTSFVSVNTAELAGRYRDRMRLELPRLIGAGDLERYHPPRFTRYRVVLDRTSESGHRSGLVTGIPSHRLPLLLDRYLGDGSVEESVMRSARNYISFFSLAQNASGVRRVENLVSGYKSLIELNQQCRTIEALRQNSGFMNYLEHELAKARLAVLDEIKVDWSGGIVRRDSPHGPKLKFRAALAVNGPQEVELSYIRFHPYWDNSVVVLENQSRKVLPHQAFMREYLVDIDKSHLESKFPDSLRFTAEIVYSNLSLPINTVVAVRDIPSLSVKFEPDFHFVPPVARVDIDQVVSSMNLKAVITKPNDYAGTVTLSLKTPRGLFAGAYKTTWELTTGRTSETVRIPFSVSNLFEQGIQEQVIELSTEGITLDADTSLIRIASCDISDKVNVGLFPDSAGLLEDILRMTSVRYLPITERALVTADLDAYEMLMIGAGALRRYPDIAGAKDRLEDYLRHGGSLLIFGQPNDWPEGLLPVSFVPTTERISKDQVSVRLPEGRVVSEGYKIDFASLLAYFDRERLVSPAVMAPSELVIVTKSGAGLLSLSRIGEGQIIYCGLPLTEMIAGLNLEAIHLLANLLNY